MHLPFLTSLSGLPGRTRSLMLALALSCGITATAQSVSGVFGSAAYPVLDGTPYAVNVSFTNWEKNSQVHTLDYSLNAGSQLLKSARLTFESPLLFGESQSITFEIPPAERAGIDDISITVAKVDGKDNRYTFTTSGSRRFTLTQPVRRKVVIEDLTGMWCPNCPPGIASLEHLNRVLPDRFIGIAAHDADALGINGDYSTVFSKFRGRPKLVLNGANVVPPYTGNSSTPHERFGLAADVKKAATVSGEIDLRVQAEWSADLSSIIAHSTTTWRCTDGKNKYRIAYVVTADSLKSPYFVQHNNSAGDPFWKISVPEMQLFYNGSYYMSGLTYNDVAVAAEGIDKGIERSLPEKIEVDNAYRHRHIFTAVRSRSVFRYIKDLKNVHVVALIIDPATRTIINAERCTVQPPSVPIESIKLSADKLSCMPDELFSLTAALSTTGATSRLLWEVSDTTVLRSLGDGKFRALTPGEATVTARADDRNGATASCVVTIASLTGLKTVPATLPIVTRRGDIVLIHAKPGLPITVRDLTGRTIATTVSTEGRTRMNIGRAPIVIVDLDGRHFTLAR